MVILQYALVAAQFALLAYIALNAGLVSLAPVPAGIASAGALLGAATVLHNRPGNFNIRPVVRESARLIVTGPYRFIRHPMYAALLLVTGGMALNGWPKPDAAFACAALALVLAIKMGLEERALRRRFPKYAAYCARTARLIPGVL